MGLSSERKLNSKKSSKGRFLFGWDQAGVEEDFAFSLEIHESVQQAAQLVDILNRHLHIRHESWPVLVIDHYRRGRRIFRVDESEIEGRRSKYFQTDF